MTDAAIEIPIVLEDGDNIINTENETEKETKDSQPKQRSVSFNRDVHVKTFGKPRDSSRGGSVESQIRKEPFTHLSEKELLDEAAKIIAQADSVSCTTDHPADKFFSLPHRKKPKPEADKRKKNDDQGESEPVEKKALGRSTSDVGTQKKKAKERTSLSTLFRRAKTASPDRSLKTETEKSNHKVDKPVKKADVIFTPKKGVLVKRSKSDVSDNKSNTNLIVNPKPIRKRSGSESEEFLKSLRNKKAQLSPIIEASNREDYFSSSVKSKKEVLLNEDLPSPRSNNKEVLQSNELKVNPVEKPPRFRSPEKNEPKPPIRIKRSRAISNLSDSQKIIEPPISETPKRKTEVKKTLLVDEIDRVREKDINPLEIKEKIKESINKLQNNIYSDKDMIHSSQQPPDKPPLTKGHTVDHIVRILREDQLSPPPKTHLITQPNSGSNNQPFSYIRPSVSPDPNLYVRPASPERIPTPVNTMYPEKGVVYAQVVRNQHDNGNNGLSKQTVHKTYSPAKEFGYSDDDEGLGHEDRFRNVSKLAYNYDKKNDSTKSKNNFGLIDSPITPRFREYKLTKFDDYEPTYTNGILSKTGRDYVDSGTRGRADGMDSKGKTSIEPDVSKEEHYDLNDLSHRRKLLESRIKARRFGDKNHIEMPMANYRTVNDPLYEAASRMKATEKYVNETARYYRHTLERDGFVEDSIADSYSKLDSDNNNKVKFETESRTFDKCKRGDDRNDRYLNSEEKDFPPEPEYEPPSLESNVSMDKKYKHKTKLTSSTDYLNRGPKYSKSKDERFGKRKGHYASNPEIVQEREEIYENAKYDPKFSDTYHNSLRRDKSYDREHKERRYYEERHGTDETGRYHRSPRSRLNNDRDRENKFVDSGIENDYRKDSSGELNKTNKTTTYKSSPRRDSDDDRMNSTRLISSERLHTENQSEQIYANGNYRNGYPSKYSARERSIDDGSHFDPRIDRFDQSPVRRSQDKVSAKPPKAATKLSGLEKVKKLFSSSKKSKQEIENSRTRVLKSPEYLGNDRYLPEPYGRSPRRYRGSSEDRESDHKRSDVESDIRRDKESRNRRVEDSPVLAERYSNRRRLATPSPTPSPPPRRPPPLLRPTPPPDTSAGNWFKSLDRLTRKKKTVAKVKENGVNTEDGFAEPRRAWSKKPLASPAKNLRFFGDTDHESDANVSKHTVVTKTMSNPQKTSLRKTISNSSNGLNEMDQRELSKKSYSLSNLRDDSSKPYRSRNLHNILENHSNSEAESFGRQRRYEKDTKPPISPYDRRSRSQSSSLVKESKGDLRRNGYSTSRSELRDGSSSELRSSKDRGSRGELRSRRRTPVHSGESSTEGESSHQSQRSQRSVVYLHATTVGDIPDPERTRGRSRDDVSSLSSQAKTVTRSFSFLAPWRPRHYAEPYDVHYAQTARPNKRTHKQTSKQPNKDNGTLKNRSSSQTTLNRKKLVPSRLSSSNNTLYKKRNDSKENINTLNTQRRERDYKKSVSTEVLSKEKERERLSDSERVSRSISMPRDQNKKAGWFKLAKSKKTEQTSRVR